MDFSQKKETKWRNCKKSKKQSNNQTKQNSDTIFNSNSSIFQNPFSPKEDSFKEMFQNIYSTNDGSADSSFGSDSSFKEGFDIFGEDFDMHKKPKFIFDMGWASGLGSIITELRDYILCPVYKSDELIDTGIQNLLSIFLAVSCNELDLNVFNNGTEQTQVIDMADLIDPTLLYSDANIDPDAVYTNTIDSFTNMREGLTNDTTDISNNQFYTSFSYVNRGDTYPYSNSLVYIGITQNGILCYLTQVPTTIPGFTFCGFISTSNNWTLQLTKPGWNNSINESSNKDINKDTIKQVNSVVGYSILDNTGNPVKNNILYAGYSNSDKTIQFSNTIFGKGILDIGKKVADGTWTYGNQGVDILNPQNIKNRIRQGIDCGLKQNQAAKDIRAYSGEIKEEIYKILFLPVVIHIFYNIYYMFFFNDILGNRIPFINIEKKYYNPYLKDYLDYFLGIVIKPLYVFYFALDTVAKWQPLRSFNSRFPYVTYLLLFIIIYTVVELYNKNIMSIVGDMVMGKSKPFTIFAIIVMGIYFILQLIERTVSDWAPTLMSQPISGTIKYIIYWVIKLVINILIFPLGGYLCVLYFIAYTFFGIFISQDEDVFDVYGDIQNMVFDKIYKIHDEYCGDEGGVYGTFLAFIQTITKYSIIYLIEIMIIYILGNGINGYMKNVNNVNVQSFLLIMNFTGIFITGIWMFMKYMTTVKDLDAKYSVFNFEEKSKADEEKKNIIRGIIPKSKNLNMNKDKNSIGGDNIQEQQLSSGNNDVPSPSPPPPNDITPDIPATGTAAEGTAAEGTATAPPNDITPDIPATGTAAEGTAAAPPNDITPDIPATGTAAEGTAATGTAALPFLPPAYINPVRPALPSAIPTAAIPTIPPAALAAFS